MIRTIAVLSTGRQDWGILRSTCRAIDLDPELSLKLLLGGMHCSKRFGLTQRDVIAEHFQPAELLNWLPGDIDCTPQAQAAGALGMTGDALQRQKPDALLLAGDRLETAAAAVAATVTRVPIVHLHGGEETEGAFDNVLRHSITKMSHLHLVSHSEHAERVIAMGEDPAAVHVVGAPGVDNIHRSDLPSREELSHFLGLDLRHPVVMVTLHPSTLGGDPRTEAEAVCAAMDAVPATYVITLPNADPGSAIIRKMLQQAADHPCRVAVAALGDRRYWGLMKVANAILGNSSSALVEAPAVGLPAVNVGDRQKGRLRGDNVLDAAASPKAVELALKQALSREFREKAKSAVAPFGDGHSHDLIMKCLRAWTPPQPPIKPPVRIQAA